MALDVNRPKNYRRAWKGGIDLMRKITVCSHCKRASCWQGQFYCERYKTASTVDMALAELMALAREDSSYWFRDASGVVDDEGLENFRRNYAANLIAKASVFEGALREIFTRTQCISQFGFCPHCHSAAALERAGSQSDAEVAHER